ncbi:MAG: ATP-binding cassette domain-containing protein [Oscillospiraceae bacterium]|nr:ATP-binding cassette domain-containing protein [Oscillospiraceae bacterium]
MSAEIKIKKKLGKFQLDVDIVTDSSRLGILGSSGCGKSMTLRCVAGVERPDSGRIVVDGKVLFDSEKGIDVPPQKRKVGFLFQNYALFPTMSVEKNIAAGITGSKEEKRRQVEHLLAMFRLRGLEDHLPGQLSGGQQQRVAMARMMASRPEIILLDEPFSALDGHLRDDLQREVLETLKNFDGTVMIVSHNRDETYKFSDALSIMDSGRTVQTGSTREIFAHPRSRAAARLTGCKNISPAKKLGDKLVLATDWGLRLHTQEAVPDNVKFVGFRAFALQNAREPGINVFPFTLRETIEAPFEIQYILEAEGAQWPVWFKLAVPDKNAPEAEFTGLVRIPESSVLLLD